MQSELSWVFNNYSAMMANYHPSEDKIYDIRGVDEDLYNARHFFLSRDFLNKNLADGMNIKSYSPDIKFESCSSLYFAINQPFKSIWYESSDGDPIHISVPNRNGSRGYMWGILCKEISPSDYQLAILASTDRYAKHLTRYFITLDDYKNLPKIEKYGDIYDHKDPSLHLSYAYHNLAKELANAIRKSTRIAKEKTKIKVRVGAGKDRSIRKINQVVRVVLNTERHPERSLTCHRNIEWSHSWEVMGHWRKVSGIGKDRHGKYGTKGLTWVVPYIKGKGELVKKMRSIVTESQSHQGMVPCLT